VLTGSQRTYRIGVGFHQVFTSGKERLGKESYEVLQSFA